MMYPLWKCRTHGLIPFADPQRLAKSGLLNLFSTSRYASNRQHREQQQALKENYFVRKARPNSPPEPTSPGTVMTNPHEIAFIDPALTDFDALLSGLRP